MKSRRPAAMALPTSLIIVGLMLILVTAFGKLYNSHFSLTRSSNSSRVARLGCESIYDYIVYRLEHDRSWGANAFTTSTPAGAFGDRLIAQETVGTHRIEGEIPDLELTFTADVYSFFGESADNEVTSRVSRGKAVCEVWVTHKLLRKRAEFELSVAPPFDSSVLTRADVYINSTGLVMRSRDPDRNFIRAEGDITVPNILSDNRSRFLEEDSDNFDHDGMLWAKGDVLSFEGGRPQTISTAAQVAAANQNSGGRIVSNANSNFSIFDLQAEDVRLPENQTIVREPQSSDDPDLAGRWNFVRAAATVEYTATYDLAALVEERGSEPRFEVILEENEKKRSELVTKTEVVFIDVLEHYPPDPGAPDGIASVPDKIYRGDSRVEDLVEQVEQVRSRMIMDRDNNVTEYMILSADEPIRTRNFTIEGYDLDQFSLKDEVQYGNDGAAFTFDLNRQRVSADPTVKVEVDGPLHLTSETRTDGLSGEDRALAVTPPPVLNLGVNGAGTERATVVAEQTIDIREGIVEGLGALISYHGDVKLQPAGAGSVDVDGSNTDNGLVIFANGDVELGKPEDSGSNWSFKGLVYSRGDVSLEGRGQNVSFEGAVISRAETQNDRAGIYFNDCGMVEFIYNRDMLGLLINDMPSGRIELEPVLWKE